LSPSFILLLPVMMFIAEIASWMDTFCSFSPLFRHLLSRLRQIKTNFCLPDKSSFFVFLTVADICGTMIKSNQFCPNLCFFAKYPEKSGHQLWYNENKNNKA
jgi:hypothetical protein